MYYHARPMKFVRYGKVRGNPTPGDDWEIYYKWVSNYCGYFPQVWLSRSHSRITGIRRCKDHVLFGFDIIKGFPLHYDWWEMIMNGIWTAHCKGLDPVKDAKRFSEVIFEEAKSFYEPSGDYTPEELEERNREIAEFLPGDPREYSSVEEWLKERVFVKHDQVVVPSLNLKAAKEVFCRSDKEKKKLRKMGFIEDRIKVRKFPTGWE